MGARRKVRYSDVTRQNCRLPLQRDPYPEELPDNPAPWTVEATGLSGYYVLDRDGKLVTFTTAVSFANRLCKLALQRPYSGKAAA